MCPIHVSNYIAFYIESPHDFFKDTGFWRDAFDATTYIPLAYACFYWQTQCFLPYPYSWTDTPCPVVNRFVHTCVFYREPYFLTYFISLFRNYGQRETSDTAQPGVRKKPRPKMLNPESERIMKAYKTMAVWRALADACGLRESLTRCTPPRLPPPLLRVLEPPHVHGDAAAMHGRGLHWRHGTGRDGRCHRHAETQGAAARGA